MTKSATQNLREEITGLERQLRMKRKELRKHKGLGAKKKGQGVRIGDRWPEEKARRGYVEAGSVVRKDGSEKLVGLDWENRVDELRDRAEGRCEMEIRLDKPHAFDCHGDGDDPHHIVKRSVRRDDRLTNLALISRPCHHAIDERRVRSGKLGA